MIMNSVTIALIAFACVAGGAMIGLFLNAVLPSQHLSGDAKDTVKLGMGLIGTMDRNPSWSPDRFGQEFLRHAE